MRFLLTLYIPTHKEKKSDKLVNAQLHAENGQKNILKFTLSLSPKFFE